MMTYHKNSSAHQKFISEKYRSTLYATHAILPDKFQHQDVHLGESWS